jgi:ATP-binding cassette subfamily F protein uup
LRMDKGFAHFDDWRDDIIEQDATERHKLNRKIVRETVWLHKGVTARRKRNMGRLRALMDLRQKRQDQRQRAGDVTITANEAETSGKRVIEAKNISKSFDGRAVVAPFSTRIVRGDRVGIIGPNGAGKTTLVRMLTGTLEPDEGNVKIGTSVEMASLDQGRIELSETLTLQDALTDGSGDSVIVGGVQKHVVGYMKDFLFDPVQAKTPVSRLSGGERGRLMLARAMTRPGNLLVLDEPTNDLDLETLDLLQEMISDYAGTVILVSHDRDFLDRIVTSVINYEGDGRWQEYAGGYRDMVAQRGAGMITDAKLANAETPKKKTASKPVGGSSSTKLKMSYKDKYALETLPDTMAKLEVEIAALEGKLADPNLFTKDPDAFQTATDSLTEKVKALSDAEEEWLRIEMLREEIEAQN